MIIETIKKFCAWVGVDGLLHALVCYAIMLAVYPMFANPTTGAMTAFLAALMASFGKEIFDIFKKASTAESAWHDLLCDAIGMAAAVLTWLLWWLCSL